MREREALTRKEIKSIIAICRLLSPLEAIMFQSP